MKAETKPKNILIVDDEEDILESLSLFLQDEGYLVTTATGGDEAYEQCKKNDFGLVITDVKMAKGDGLSLLKNIKSGPQAKLPVILLSGYAGITALQAFQMGAEAIFPKPFSIKIFKESVNTIFQLREHHVSRPIRVPVELPVKIEFSAESGRVDGIVKNISSGGMCVVVKNCKPNCGETCQFLLNPKNEEIRGEAKIAWVGSDSDADLSFGIQFAELSESSQEMMFQYLNFLLTKYFLPMF